MAKLKLKTKGFSIDEKRILGDAVKTAVRIINYKRRRNEKSCLRYYIELK